MMRRIALAPVLALVFAAGLAAEASASLLTCQPESGFVRASVTGFGRGDDLPNGLETFVVMLRFGADEYELYPEHLTASSLQDGVLRLQARRMLSVGEFVELQIEGKFEKLNQPFLAKIEARAERRSAQGTMRCTLI